MKLVEQIANRIKIKLNDLTIQINNISSGTGTVPVGATLEYAGTVLPTGFLFCDGSPVSRVAYANLFAVIGTSHGQGDGVNTFNLPDYRGVFLRGVDAGSGRDPNASSRIASQLGGNSGDAVGTYQEDSLQGFKIAESSQVGSFPGAGLTPTTPGIYNWDTLDRFPENDGTNGIPRISSETRAKNVSVNRIIKF